MDFSLLETVFLQEFVFTRSLSTRTLQGATFTRSLFTRTLASPNRLERTDLCSFLGEVALTCPALSLLARLGCSRWACRRDTSCPVRILGSGERPGGDPPAGVLLVAASPPRGLPTPSCSPRPRPRVGGS